MELRKTGEHDKAIKIFKHCLTMDPNHVSCAHFLFANAIYCSEWVEAFEYLKLLINKANPYNVKDYNVYLYLLNYVMELPEEYRNIAKGYTNDDFILNEKDKRYKNRMEQQRITYSIANKKFTYAFKQMRDEIANNNNVVTYRDFIIRNLLYNVCSEENKFKASILELIKCEEYEELVKILKQKLERCGLSKYDTYVLKLAEELLDIIKTKTIPNTIKAEYTSSFEAIEAKDYEAALNFSDQHNVNSQINNTLDAINLLLNAIVTEIKRLTKKEQPKENKPKKSVPSCITFVDILNELLNNNLEKAYSNISAYLKSINKAEYEFLIVNLINLSLIEKDPAFTKPMLALTYISQNNFNFNVSSYVQEFYMALSQKKFAEARVYLDIMSKASKLGHPEISVDSLMQVLDSAENIIEKKQDTKIQEKPVFIEKPKDIPKPIVHEIKTTTPKPKTVINEARNSEIEFIEAKHETLTKEHGIILLRPMNNERRKAIHRLMIKYSDMTSFSIGDDSERRIVLRYTPHISEYVPIKELLQKGQQAYLEKDYQSCIDMYLKALSFGNPRPFMYARLGLSYMKIGKKDKAIDYLTVATYLSKNDKERFEFTDLIDKLRGAYDYESAKPDVKMNETDFQNDLNDNYGIDNIDEITQELLESKKSMDEVCLSNGLSLIQTNIVKLIYARSFYSQGDYDHGDLFFKAVEKSSVKNDSILKMLDEIRKNKKFYINRTTESANRLSLVIKP